ncbi:hypothetical protein HW561_07620 [Rhodobacteraceae bacterium B1Z28]|uniref:Muconolactone isomerase domain-containing protein n=1 Tax=Ruegeria haliotis TaxID=2747601 RepID=A0ABX2PRG1_9RHOB|nr:hypothetical protein [Ruegeria haliotis]NVO55654.1 hypothetical protein [Ruegeria haliotis]
MRLMLKFTIPVEKGNQAERDGTLGKAIAALIKDVNAQASYFALEDGKRMGIVIFEEDDQARMPVINEPLFAALDAAIEIQPVLTAEDLQRGL